MLCYGTIGNILVNIVTDLHYVVVFHVLFLLHWHLFLLAKFVMASLSTSAAAIQKVVGLTPTTSRAIFIEIYFLAYNVVSIIAWCEIRGVVIISPETLADRLNIGCVWKQEHNSSPKSNRHTTHYTTVTTWASYVMWFMPFEKNGTIIHSVSKPSCRALTTKTMGSQWLAYNTCGGHIIIQATMHFTYIK